MKPGNGSEESNINLTASEAIEILNSEEEKTFTNWSLVAQKKVQQIAQTRITYTTNVFLPVTFLCRNSCSYCNYKKTNIPQGEEYIHPEYDKKMVNEAQKVKVSEFLITMGEKPETVIPEAKRWLSDHNFDTTIDYTYEIAKIALSHGILPHINAGSLNTAELSYLKQVSASMGMMLENVSSRFRREGMPHYESPDKDPKKRISTLIAAGKLKIPFTTGLLIGIGETPKEIVASLFTIKNLHLKYDHIQEVILQPYRDGNNSNNPLIDKSLHYLLKKTIIIARNILPSSITIQTAPNLVRGFEHDIMKSGITDWGGISPITIDYINPQALWPSLDYLEKVTSGFGFKLEERLPIYPQYVNVPWLSPNIYEVLHDYDLITEDGLRKR